MPGIRSVRWDDGNRAKVLDALTALEYIKVNAATTQKVRTLDTPEFALLADASNIDSCLCWYVLMSSEASFFAYTIL